MMQSEHVFSIRYKFACGYSQDTNQSVHPHSLIRVIVFHLKNIRPLIIHKGSSETDQSEQMRRLIWVFDGRSCQLVPFAGH